MIVSFHVTNRYWAPPGAEFRTYTGYPGDSDTEITVTTEADRDWWPGDVVEVDLERVEVEPVEDGPYARHMATGDLLDAFPEREAELFGEATLAEEVEQFLKGQAEGGWAP